MSLFYYPTYKYVIIKDRRLGIAYYILVALIILYTLVQMLIHKAYLEYDTSPQGTMRIMLHMPDEELRTEDLPTYCCNPSSSHKKNLNNCTECEALDALELRFPMESTSVTVATFIKEKWEERQAGAARYTSRREKSFHPLRPEQSVIKMEHSVTAFHDAFAASHRMMVGSLVDMQGKKIKDLNSESQHKVDKISLTDLLRAAGIDSLDHESDALNADLTPKGKSYRKNGLVLHVTVSYKNSHHTYFGTGKPEYTYSVRHVPYSDYKVREASTMVSIEDFDGHDSREEHTSRRIIKKRFACRVEFRQAGKIGRFVWSNLLLQMISILGLFTLTATIVDAVALNLVPNRSDYTKWVYDESHEFHPEDEQDDADDKTEEEGDAEWDAANEEDPTSDAEDKLESEPSKAVENLDTVADSSDVVSELEEDDAASYIHVEKGAVDKKTE